MNDASEPVTVIQSVGARAPRGMTVVVPAYNEEHGIGGVIEELDSVLAAAQHPYEIIVVDDSSSDRTRTVAESVTSDHLRVVSHRRNRGYGAALKTGIREARHDLICVTDADRTYSGANISDLREHLEQTGADMVVGARTGDKVVQSLVRLPAKWALTKLANYVVGERIPDINSGLRLFDRPSVMKFFEILPDGFSFTTTITVAMLIHGYRVEYVPIDYHARIGSSKIRPIRDTLNFVQLILRMGLYFAPMKIFLPLGGGLILVAMLWGAATAALFGALADVSTLVIATTGIQICVIGLLAELIRLRVRSPYEAKSDE